MLDIIAMEEQFTGEYKRAFSKISMYGTMTPIDSQRYEDRVLNIYDMLITAQNEGKPVEKIIGHNIELFCKEYYKSHDIGTLLGEIAKRIFSIMMILLIFSFVELGASIATNGGFSFFENVENFTALEINATPFIVGVGVGFIVICIEAIAKNKILLKTDRIKSGVYAVGCLIIFAMCVAVGLVLFGDIDAHMPLWMLIALSCGYCAIYMLVVAVRRCMKNGTVKNTERVDKQELKEFQKQITLEYDIRTSAEAMAERFDKMKEKWAKKGKGEPTFDDFVVYIVKEHRFTKYASIFFAIITLGTATVNIGLNIGDEKIFLTIFASAVAAIVSFLIFGFAINAIKEVEEAQRIVLDECAKKNIDIYHYVKNMHEDMEQ